MINRYKIQKEQAIDAIGSGEFDKSITASNDYVVIILTQDWCPQWSDMKGWIYDVEIGSDIDIYELEYNKTDYFEAFMNFKEGHFGNQYVPYLRFYKHGILVSEANYTSERQFISAIQNM